MVEEKYQNALEPASLVEAFLDNPPEGFAIALPFYSRTSLSVGSCTEVYTSPSLPSAEKKLKHYISPCNDDIHAFFADLDLFTTLDDNAKKIVDRLRKFAPINFIIKKFFTPNVLFIGTTVSEYCWLSNNLNFNDFMDKILISFRSSKRQFLIIKDLPQDSPLLTEQEIEPPPSLFRG